MDLSNPLEIVILCLLVILTLWIIERVIAGAFKTVLFGFLIACILILFDIEYYKNQKIKQKPLPKFNFHDLGDYNSFNKKFGAYKNETIKDIKFNYINAKKQLENK